MVSPVLEFVEGVYANCCTQMTWPMMGFTEGLGRFGRKGLDSKMRANESGAQAGHNGFALSLPAIGSRGRSQRSRAQSPASGL